MCHASRGRPEDHGISGLYCHGSKGGADALHGVGSNQNLFYNHYHHGHFLLIWQGVSFPDGMVVLEGPEPGYFTDVMVWRDCQLRQDLEQIML